MSPSPCYFTTALDKSFTLTVSLPVIFCSTSTYLLFSRVGNPFLTLRNILYIHSTPYNGPAWKHTLCLTNLSHKFPNLVHDITYGSPIGNPPSLLHTFLPPNLSLANIHPNLIDLELATEVATGSISGPFSPDEASIIFGGFYC